MSLTPTLRSLVWKTPVYDIPGRRAPRGGEHTIETYRELLGCREGKKGELKSD